MVIVEINQDWSCLKKQEGFISFSFDGDGSRNRLEVKLLDADGTNFGWLSKQGDSVGTRPIELPLNDFKYWYGGNRSMNWQQVESIRFAVSKYDQGEGGSGTMIIKDAILLPIH